jgi:hypothetical protein
MPKKIAIALTVVSASAVVIWMINSGWLTSNLRAQEQPVSGIPASGTRVLPVPDPPFCGVIDRKVKEFQAGLSQSRHGRRPNLPKRVPEAAPGSLHILRHSSETNRATASIRRSQANFELQSKSLLDTARGQSPDWQTILPFLWTLPAIVLSSAAGL